MRFRVLLSAVAIVTVAGSARAQVNIESVLVGFTSNALPASAGFLAFSAACQAQYPNTRMCSTQEILGTRRIPSGLSGSALVGARVAGTYGAGPGIVDVTGIPFSRETCGETTGGMLAVTSTGVFREAGSTSDCADGLSVACCGLPVDPAQGDLDQDGAATVRDVTILRRMLAGDPLLLSSSP